MASHLAYFFTMRYIILTAYPWIWWYTICNWLYLLKYLLERNFDFYVIWHRFNFYSLRNPLLNLWLLLKFKTNVCFFNDRDLTKKNFFFPLSTQCKNKNCELFQKLKMKLLRMNKNKKSEAVCEKCVFPLFSMHSTLMTKILLRKKKL